MGISISMHGEKYQYGAWHPVPADNSKPFEPNASVIADWKARYLARNNVRGWDHWDEAYRLQEMLEWYHPTYHNRYTMALLSDLNWGAGVEPVKHFRGVPEGLSDVLTLIMDQRWEEVRPDVVLLSDLRAYDFNQMVGLGNEPKSSVAELTSEFVGAVLPAIDAAVNGTPPEHVRLLIWFHI